MICGNTPLATERGHGLQAPIYWDRQPPTFRRIFINLASLLEQGLPCWPGLIKMNDQSGYLEALYPPQVGVPPVLLDLLTYSNFFFCLVRKNDLWRYNITNGMWAWISGNSSVDVVSKYGVMGVAASTNMPGSRSESKGWFDTTGNGLWIFGGRGYDNGTVSSGRLNDIWLYNITTGLWTWMNGISLIDQPGNTEGAASSRHPGSREQACAAFDPINRELYLFGGYGKASSFVTFGDLWRYSIQSNTWLNVSRALVNSVAQSPGVQGVPSPNNAPGSRDDSVCWFDPEANEFWLFGGYSGSRALKATVFRPA